MLGFVLLAGYSALISLLVGCTTLSNERIGSNSLSEAKPSQGSDLLPQGVAVGDVSSERALLWLRTEGPAVVRVVWVPLTVWERASTSAAVVAPVSKTAPITTTAEADYTLTIPLDNLSPATRYRYQVTVGTVDQAEGKSNGMIAAIGEFVTSPDDQISVPVTFAWSGDLGGQGRCRQGGGGYPIFDIIHRHHPNFFLFLGDTIYSDSPCPVPPNEPGADFTAATLQTYRLRHRYQRGAEAFRKFLEDTPVYVAWDDHEVRNNFAGPFDEQMPSGRQALREYWPISSPANDPNRMYRRVRYGADLELFILDTRQYRSRNSDPDGPTKTMLGSAQLTWLLDGLHRSTATWKVIVTSVPLSIPKGGGVQVPGNDGWAGGPDGTGFEGERQVIVDSLLSHNLKNVVFLAGDVHLVQVNAYDPNRDGVIDFHEYIVGPLSARPGKLTATEDGLNPTRLFTDTDYYNFGLVRVARDIFEVTVIDGAGNQRFSHVVPAR